MIELLYLLIGLVAGVCAGLFGVGGGIVVVPGLHLVLPLTTIPNAMIMHVTIASSLASMVFTSLASVIAHIRFKNIEWTIVKAMLPGVMLGALLGAWVADDLSGNWLRILFGLFCMGIALQVWFEPHWGQTSQLPTRWVLSGFSGLFTFFGALLGAGSGSFLVAFLNTFNIPMHKTVAISSACIFLTSAKFAVSSRSQKKVN